MTITRVWQAGAELGQGLLEFTSRDNASLNIADTERVKTGTYSFRIGTNNGWTKIFGTSYSQFRVSFHWNHSGYGTSTYGFLRFSDGATNVVDVRLDGSTNTFGLYVDGSQVATAQVTSFAAQDTWVHVGIDCKIDSSGWFYMYFDGVTVFSFSGNTAAAASDIDRVEFNPGFTGWNIHVYLDDIYFDDASGEAGAALVPDRRFAFSSPDGNGDASEWLGSDADQTDNYLLVDDIPPDDDTTYVKTDAAGSVDLYAVADVSLASGWSISSVIPVAVAKKIDGTADVQLGLHIVNAGGTIDGTVNATALATDYAFYTYRATTQPDASAWDESDFNATQFGVKSAGAF